MAKKFLLYTVFLLIPGWISAQTTDFPSNPADFFPAFEKFMKTGENNKEMKDFMESFEGVWNDGPFNIYQKQVIDYCNALQKKKLRVTPHFKAYVQSVMDFYHSGHPKSNFDGWMQGLEWILKKKSGTYLVDYLELSSALFTENALYKSAGHIWYTTDINFKITFENDEVVIIYPSSTLRCEGKDDSTEIANTSGIFYPFDAKFVGKGGRIFWDRAGLPRTDVYADLNNYNINIKRSTFKADSVNFYNVNYFSSTLMGRLEEKLIDLADDKDPNFPKFDSYTKRFEIKNIFENIHYEGGFSFYGNRFVAKGDSVERAFIRIYQDNKLFVKAEARNFTIEKEKITSSRATITLYMGDEDSIYHPGLQFKYLQRGRENGKDTLINQVEFLRIEDGVEQTPFYDTFHKVEMYFESMTWKMNEKFVRMASSKGSEQNLARFRSLNFFNEVEYTRMQGMDDIHPLSRLNTFLRDKNNNQPNFKAIDFAKYLKLDLTQTRQMLMNFSIAGLVNYSIDKEEGFVTEQFYHYILSASRRTDYDVIEVFSKVDRNQYNAQMSLVDYRMDIKGVNDILISDSQKVEIHPYRQQITMKKNLDMSFDGRIFAGRMGIYGSHFDFLYQDFKFKLQDVDSVKIIARTREKMINGLYGDTILNSLIENMNAEVLIDHPNNKSGLKPFPEYPSLISLSKSYVTYHYKYVEQGVYKKDEFYFELDPFKKDTIDNFNTNALFFDGILVSAGIFPNIREKLKIMPDYALGFTKVTGKSGLEAYGGKGTYYDTLTLSNRGLRGGGKLEYLTAEAWSRDFVFYPDSMNTFAYKFGIKKKKGGIETPDVKAKDVMIHWEPEKDKFEAKETGSKFEMYEGESTMNGKLTLTPSGLEGDGDFHFGINADMVSNQFKFKSEDFKTDSASFSLTDNVTADITDTTQVAFKTDNVRADVTFVGRKASLKSNTPDSYVEFPQNKFIAYMEEMEYHMDKNEVDLNSRKVDEIGLKGALFVSTDPRLDSLSFVAPRANFVVTDKLIDCSGVKFIDVADSRIFPIDEKIIIRKGAKLDPFIDAKIWVGKTDKIHILEHADVTVFTSHKYSGTADYNFVDEIGKNQVIKFNKVDVDEKDVTIAEGLVEQIVDFTLSPHYSFKGKVNLYGKNPFLTFDGYFKIVHLCQTMKNQWVRFNTEIDPNNILIPIGEEPLNDEQNKTFNGFLFASDSTGLYPAMFSPKIRYSDYDVLTVKGFLYFDKKSQEYKIARKEKIFDPELPGNYMSFNTNTCSSYGEGQMELGSKLGQVDMQCAGSITHEPTEDNITMDILLTLNFKMDNTLFKFVSDQIKTVTTDGGDIQDEKTKTAITDLLDSAKADKLYSDLNNEGKFKKLPKQLNKTLVLTDLHLKWDKNQRALLHSGEVGVLVFNGEQVNKSATAMIEIDRKSSGDIITIYLEFDDKNWYYFYYRNNVMQIYSGLKEFNDMHSALDGNKRSFSHEGLPTYQTTIGTNRRVDKFKEKFGVTTEDK